MLLFVVAFFGVCVSSLLFDRFDSSQNIPAPGTAAKTGLTARFRRRKSTSAKSGAEVRVSSAGKVAIRFSRLESLANRNRFVHLVIAELKLMLKGVSRWWMLVALGLAIAGALVPAEVGRQFILPFAWIWPLLIWSKMGVRETRYRTHQLIYSSAGSITRQFPALWLAGVVLALMTGSGMLIRTLIDGNWQILAACGVGAIFIPTMAIFLGVWSGSGKLFEILYLLLWYAGPMNRVPFMDFMGATNDSIAIGMPLFFLLIAAVLFALAIAGRRKKLGGG
jgi:hypothetical protein